MKAEDFAKLPKDQQDQLIAKIADIERVTKQFADEESELPKMTMKEFREKMEGMVKEYIKGMTQADRKHFVFPGIGNDAKLNDDLTPEGKFTKTVKFLQAMVGKNQTVLNTMHEEVRTKANLSEGTTTAGGFLVPEEFKAEILRLVPTFGVGRANVRIIPMARDIIHIPASGTTDNSAIWTAEGAQILNTQPSFRECILTINKLAAIPKVTNELLQDANVDVIQYLASIISWAFAKEEDNQIFNGTGSPFVGVLTATGVPTSPNAGGTAFICLSYQDLVNATANIYANATSNAKFYLHRSMIAQVRGLITTAGAPIFGATTNDVAGYPMVNTEILPGKASSTSQTSATPFGVFGDLRMGVAMGERGSMTMKLTEEGTVGGDNLFEKDMVALRMIERIAIGVLLPSAFTRLQC